MHTRGTLIWPILNNARLLDQIKPSEKKANPRPLPTSLIIDYPLKQLHSSTFHYPNLPFPSPKRTPSQPREEKKKERKNKKGKKKKKSREPLSSASPRKIPVSPDNSGDLSPSPPPAGVEEKTSSPARSAPLFHSNEMMRR